MAAVPDVTLSPDGRKAIAYFRSLEQAVEQATAMLSTRPDVGHFRIYATTGFGHHPEEGGVDQ